MVEIEELQLGAEAVQPRHEIRVVETWAAVQDGKHHPSVSGVRELPGPDNHESKVDPS